MTVEVTWEATPTAGENRNVDQCVRDESHEKGWIGGISNIHLSESADIADVGHKSILPSFHVILRPERFADGGDPLQRWRDLGGGVGER